MRRMLTHQWGRKREEKFTNLFLLLAHFSRINEWRRRIGKRRRRRSGFLPFNFCGGYGYYDHVNNEQWVEMCPCPLAMWDPHSGHVIMPKGKALLVGWKQKKKKRLRAQQPTIQFANKKRVGPVTRSIKHFPILIHSFNQPSNKPAN